MPPRAVECRRELLADPIRDRPTIVNAIVPGVGFGLQRARLGKIENRRLARYRDPADLGDRAPQITARDAVCRDEPRGVGLERRNPHDDLAARTSFGNQLAELCESRRVASRKGTNLTD